MPRRSSLFRHRKCCTWTLNYEQIWPQISANIGYKPSYKPSLRRVNFCPQNTPKLTNLHLCMPNNETFLGVLPRTPAERR
jgi:hypothetical protein